MKLAVLRTAVARWFAIAALVVAGVMLSQPAYAAPSPICPTQTPTVANGGSVTVDVSNCDGNFNIGMGGPFPSVTANGSITLSPQSGPGTQTVTYVHNGNSATSDTFYLEDQNGDTLTFNVTISPPTSSIVVSPASLPTLAAGTAINQALTATGGTGPYAFTVNGGVLPAGLSLSSSGSLSGTPTNRGTFSFSVRAQDSLGAFTSKGYNGSVQNPSLSLATPTVTLTRGTPASAQLATNGGLSPHIYATEPPGAPMPFGLSLSSSGLITGTPATTGSATVQLRVTDASTPSNAAYFELETLTVTVVDPTLVITPAALNPMISGTAFTQALAATGGTGPYSFTVQSGALPTGLTLSATGEISGTPTRRNAYTVTIQAQDSLGVTGTRVYTGSVGFTPLVTTPQSFTFNQGAPVNVTLATTGGVSPYTYTTPIEPLPAGLSLSTSGVLTGTPTALGSSTVSLRVRDASTPGSYIQGSTLTFDIVSVPAVSIAVSPASVAEDGAANLVYTVARNVVSASAITVNITASGNATSGTDYSGAVTSVVIPANAASATITIDPAADAAIEANETVILTVASGSGYTVGAPASATGTITNDDLPTASIAVSPASVVEDGAANLTYTVTLSAAAFAPLPVNFILGGTANSDGTDYATVNSPVIIPAGATSQTIVIDPNATGLVEPDETVVITLASGAGYTVGASASATGTIVNDDFPSLFVDNVSVTEGNSGTTNAVFTISLSAPATTGGVSFDIATFNSFAVAGQDFVAKSQTGLTIAEGASSTTFTVAVNGDLLNEIDENFFVRITNVVGARQGGFQGTGTITNDDGLPAVSIGSMSVVEGAGGGIISFPVTLDAPSGQNVMISVATANGSATAGSDYAATAFTFTFSPGETSKVFSVTINGDQTPEPNENFTVSLSNAVNATIGTGTGTGTIINDDVPLTILPLDLPDGTVGAFYSAILTTSGGTAPYTYTLTAGGLPDGLTLSPDGTLSGTPIAANRWTFTIMTRDSSGAPGPYSASQSYTVDIAVPVIELTPVSLPNADFGVPYSQTITADGSVGPYSFAVAVGAGSLPDGITLAPDGTLSGTPTRSGPTGFTIIATDATAARYLGGRAYSINVDVPALILPATTLPDGGTDTAYSAQINLATGGVAPYSYAVTSGQLPTGLSFAPGGAITGTPTAAGLFTFAVTASDSNNNGPRIAGQNYTINIVNTPPVANPVTLNVAYNGGLTPVPLSITGNANAAAVVTAPTHGRAVVHGLTIEYIPDSGYAGPDSFTYTASNNGAVSAPALVTLNVAAPAITITAGGPLTATIGTRYSQTFTFNGGTQPFTALQVTGLPAGVQVFTIGAGAIQVAGTPTSAGSFTLTVSGTDASTGTGPFGASQTFTLVVAGPTFTMSPGASTLTAPYNGAFTQAFTASGGVGPFTYALTGALPTGLSFSGNTLSGTATAPGNYPIAVTATDTGSSGAGSPFTIAQNYTINVPAPTITIAPETLPAGSVGVTYSQAATAAGGVASYSYTVTAGAVPPGLTLSVGGMLTGTPTAGGAYNFTLTATDANGQSGSRTYGLTIGGASLTLPATPLADGQVGAPYNATLNPATGGTAPYSYAVSAGALPSGMTLSSGGALLGTPTAFGTFNFSATATDSSTGAGPYSATQSYSLRIEQSAPVANSVSATVAYASTANPIALDITGGAAASVAIASTPTSGTALASGTSITYTPNASFAGTDSFTYTATNAGGTSIPATVTINVTDPAITIAAGGPLTATAGAAYSQTFTFSGGAQPFTGYQVANLPTGLSITGTGANSVTVSGTPTQSGSFALDVSGTDASTGNGPFNTQQIFTLVVAAPSFTMTPGAGSLTVPYGAAYTQAFTASGGVGPFTYALTGTLPAGLTFSGNTLTGTPTVPGSYVVTVTATDTGSTGAGAPFTISQTYTIDVAPPTIIIAPATLPAGTVGTTYSQTVIASGGVASYSYAVTAGTEPAGLTLSAGGVLSGTPTAGGTFNLTITATDANGQAGSQAYSLTIAAATLALPPTTLPDGQVSAAYNATLNPATGGTSPYRYAVSAGALPAGMTLSASGGLSGTPTAFGTFNFSVTATDSSTGAGPYSATQSYSVRIEQQAPVANGVSATVGYNSTSNPITLNITGAATSVAIATTPASGTAVVSGTSVTYSPNIGYSGTDSFTYTATNAGGTSVPATVTITVIDPVIAIVAGGSLTATTGTAYSQTFAFSGGSQPFSSYQVTGLPTGLAISGSTADSITISGTATQSGSFALIVSGTDASTGNGPFNTQQSFTLVVNAPALTLTPATGSFTAPYSAAYSQAITATGGVGPYNYSLTGNLPAGVTLNPSTGLLSGSPTASGLFNFAVTATDTGSTGAGAPFTVQGTYSLNVVAPVVTVTPTNLPGATAGAAYSAALTATGGVAPYRFTLAGGALPAGVSLSAGGTVSGTPTAAGSFAFNVTVTDANGQVGAASLTLTVGNTAITITPATLPAGTQGVAYSQRLTAAGGLAPYTYAVSSGTLPQGLTINAGTGVIAGTPTGSGNATFAVTVTDSTGGTPSTATITYTLQIVARPNPANDPEVRGLIQAQVNSARRLVDTQVGNFHRRLEGLRRGGGEGGFSNSLRISASDHCIDTVTAWTNPICANVGGNLGGPNRQPGSFGSGVPSGMGVGGMAAGGMLGGGPIGSATPANGEGAGNEAAAGPDGSGSVATPLTIWAGGTIRWGDRDEKTGRPSQSFESEGVTFGADYRFSPSFAAGIGAGLGRDTADVGRNGSQSEGEAKTLAIYGSHLLGRGLYIDWLAGYQWLDFDLRRYVTLSGQMVNSSRSGRQWFGSVSAGADIETGNWRFTPYARIDAQRGKLKGYTENSGSLFDLTYLDQDVAFTSIGAGAKIDYRIAVENGFFLPRLRLEYQRDIERNGDAFVAYFDQVSGPFNGVPLTGYARARLLMGIGVEMAIGDRTAVDIEYSNRQNSGAGSDQGVLVNVKQDF